MKTEDLLIIGGSGLLLYTLLKPKEVEVAPIKTITPSQMPVERKAYPEIAIYLQEALEEKKEQLSPEEQAEAKQIITDLSSGKATNQELVNLINTFASRGLRLPRTSETVERGVTATIKKTGERLKGNIARLGTGKTVFVGIKKSTKFSGVRPAKQRLSLKEHLAKYGLKKR